MIDRALAEAFGEVSIRRTEMVGPVIGRELVRKALLAMLIAGMGILVYISFRFEYRFGIAAILALDSRTSSSHWVLVPSWGESSNTPFIAAILTIVGYSDATTPFVVFLDRHPGKPTAARRATVTTSW